MTADGPPPRPVRVALVGCGSIASLAHVPALLELEATLRVGAVVDASPPRLAAVGEELHVPPAGRYADLATLLEAGSGIELAIVALPPAAQLDVIGPLLAAGIPVLCEKPVGPASELVLDAIPSEGEHMLGVIHNYLHRTDVAAAVEAVNRGRIGTPRLVRLERPDDGHFGGSGIVPNWRRMPRLAGGGCLLDNAYHWFYVAEALASAPIARVHATTGRHAGAQVEDVAIVVLDHTNGAITVIETAWCATGAQAVLEAHGSGGSVRLLGDGRPCELVTAEGVEVRQRAYRNPYTTIFAASAAAVRAGAHPGAPIADCLRVLRCVKHAYDSAASGRRIDVLPGAAVGAVPAGPVLC